MGRRTSSGLVTILLLLAASFVFAMFQGGFVSWFIFYAFLPVAILALILTLFGLSQVSVERRISHTHCRSGETVEVVLEIKNPYRLPLLYLTVTDWLPPGLDQEGQKVELVAYPAFRKKCSLSYTIGPLPRGDYRWRQLDLATGDFFGLVKSFKRVAAPARLLVYPRYHPIELWELTPHTGWGRYQTFNWANRGEDAPFVVGVRDYVAGDRLTRIHWKASARSGGLKSKEFEYQTAQEVMLFLNREQKAYGGQQSLFERAVAWCASLAHHALTQHISCGLVSAGAVHTLIPLDQGQVQRQRIFDHLVYVQPDAYYPFVQTVMQEAAQLTPGVTAALITPVFDQRLLQLIATLARRRIQTQLFLIKNGKPTRDEDRLLARLPKKGIQVFIITSVRFPNRLLRRDAHGSTTIQVRG